MRFDAKIYMYSRVSNDRTFCVYFFPRKILPCVFISPVLNSTMTALCVYQFWKNNLPSALISYCVIIRYSRVHTSYCQPRIKVCLPSLYRDAVIGWAEWALVSIHRGNWQIMSTTFLLARPPGFENLTISLLYLQFTLYTSVSTSVGTELGKGGCNCPLILHIDNRQSITYWWLFLTAQTHPPFSPPNFLDLPTSLVLRFKNVRESLGTFLFGVIYVLWIFDRLKKSCQVNQCLSARPAGGAITISRINCGNPFPNCVIIWNMYHFSEILYLTK